MPASTITGAARSRAIAAVATFVAAAALLLFAAGAGAAEGARGESDPPWRSADQITTELFEAQTDLILEDASAPSIVAAKRALAGPLRAGLAASAPADLALIDDQLDRAADALAAGDSVSLAAARGTITAALRRGAFRRAIELTEADRAEAAREWLQIRDFRQSTRFTRVGTEATDALIALADGETTPDEAVLQVRKDLLDTYQSRLGTNRQEAEKAAERHFPERLAETAAIVDGYWQILAGAYREQRGAADAERTSREFAQLARAAGNTDLAAFRAADLATTDDLDGFTAAPFTAEEQARRAAQLTRFLDLIPKEYDHGTDDGRITIPFELQEATAFEDGVEQAWADIKSDLIERDPQAVEAVDEDLALLKKYVNEANERTNVVSLDEVNDVHDRLSDRLDALYPDEWKESSDDADYDLVDISVDQMVAAIGAGQKQLAEQARLSAYAFFEFGPELKLNAFDPQLVAEIEGLFWYGARGVPGLATLVSQGAPTSEVRETTLVLDDALAEAREKTGEGVSDATAITNAALIVFREGLEAILIIAAITASMIGARAALRKPIYRGALLALPASLLGFVLAVALLGSLAAYGEKVEAVVGVVAIGVLVIVLNWFFHRVYWTEWIATHRKRGKALTGGVAAGAAAGTATIAGLYVLGFTSVFREGMETVLFLQALQLSSGVGVVAAGVALGLAGTAVVGFLTFKAERKLPYKKMLIVTGVLIALVLFTMVGNTVRTLQGVGWFPIHPIDVDIPLWMGTWLGIHPSVETLLAQVVAVVFVIGSYWAAGWYSKRQLRIQREQWEAEQAAGTAPDESPSEPEESHENAGSEESRRVEETV
ncbi:MAG: FTR1 family protein [Solirubrobacterales bacterium]|nr:FTR1 family protein [Solirubrobacterales bacterium]